MCDRTPSSSPAFRVGHLSLLSEVLAGTNAISFESQTSRAHRMCRVAVVPHPRTPHVGGDTPPKRFERQRETEKRGSFFNEKQFLARAPVIKVRI
jgi:hypothetical protein